MVTLGLDADDCKNAAELVETYFFQNIHDLQEINELDNIDYLRSMLLVLNELNAAAKGKRGAKDESQT